MHATIQQALDRLPPEAAVLDCGGWFKPLRAATHVADLMPYETRGSALQVAPLPGERFRKATWSQVDFLGPGLQLPFADHSFAFVHCSHTVEDLPDPFPLLREIMRVGCAGVIVTPSRLCEQTAGSRDRMTSRLGHPHHHWICETENGLPLLCPKADSLDHAWWQTAVPLRCSERLQAADPSLAEWIFQWEGTFSWRVERGPAARQRAIAFAQKTERHRATSLLLDLMHRQLRFAKYRVSPGYRTRADTWWPEIVELSQRFSSLPLR